MTPLRVQVTIAARVGSPAGVGYSRCWVDVYQSDERGFVRAVGDVGAPRDHPPDEVFPFALGLAAALEESVIAATLLIEDRRACRDVLHLVRLLADDP